jgi:hypothetical protein
MDNSNTTVPREKLPQHLLEAIHKLVHAGASYEGISSVLGLKLEVVQQVLTNDPPQVAQLTESIREELRQNRLMTSDGNYYEQSRLEEDLSMSSERMINPEKKAKISEICWESSIYYSQDLQTLDTQPSYIYSYKRDTDQLHRTNLVTGEQSSHRVPSYQFKSGCCWSEVGGLLITGGGCYAVREVVRIDSVREFAVVQHPPMLTPRAWHAAVYHSQRLYLLGGLKGSSILRDCERYVIAENRWEPLPSLPRACCNTSGVVVERSLYALGGSDGLHLDLVQKLCLESLTWEVLQLRLPHAGYGIPCFKLRGTEVYLVVNKTLCSFTALEVRPLKRLTEDMHSWCGGSYCHRGTLYCFSDSGVVRSHEIGSLRN